MQSEADYTDERTLLTHIQANIPAAKRWLYDQYAPAMYGLLLLLIQDEQKAGDTLVEIFARLKEFVNDYNKSAGLSLFSWLLKKTRETAIKDSPDAELTSNKANTLVQFSGTLHEQSRQAFVLSFCKGLSRDKIAERMGLNEQQVIELLKEAMIAFRNFSRK